MKILLVLPDLGAGGAERVAASLANRWASAEHEVTLLTLGGETDFFALHPVVSRVSLGQVRPSRSWLDALKRNLARFHGLRQAVRDVSPDVVVSFLDRTNSLTLAATLGLGVPVVISERSNPQQAPLPIFWKLLRTCFYRRCSALVVQTEFVRQWFRRLVPDQKIRVIPNVVTTASLQGGESSAVPVPEFAIAAMGRLQRVKGFDLLLRAFARCSPSCPEWQLLILGEGPLRSELETQINELGLQGRVQLLGEIAQPASVLKQCQLFVLSSRYEGFPNALLEAMGCGLPAISFSCPSGPGEIIREGIDGALVPPGDVEGLATAMRRLMLDASLRRQMGKKAVEVRSRFAEEAILPLWDRTLDEAVAASGVLGGRAS